MMYYVRNIMYDVLCMVSDIYCTMYDVWYILYSVLCIQYNVWCTIINMITYELLFICSYDSMIEQLFLWCSMLIEHMIQQTNCIGLIIRRLCVIPLMLHRWRCPPSYIALYCLVVVWWKKQYIIEKFLIELLTRKRGTVILVLIKDK